MGLEFLWSLNQSSPGTLTVRQHVPAARFLPSFHHPGLMVVTLLATLSLPAIPSQPGAPETTAVGKEHVIIEWLKPESDGGSEISNYIVDKREKSSTR